MENVNDMTPDKAYTTRVKELKSLLKQIQNGKHLGTPISAPLRTWGHVGSLTHMINLAEEMKAFINS